MDITLFELHLPNAEFNAPFADRTATESAASPESADPSDTEDEPAGNREPGVKVGPVAALLAFVGLALLARYLRGGEAEQSTLDELEA